MDFDRIKETFEFLHDWDARYEFIVDLGQQLSPMESALMVDANRVHECMSTVWIHVQRDKDDSDRVQLQGDCDTTTVKGLVAILVSLYSGMTIGEIMETDADDVFETLGLFEHLSPTRHVGVYAMVRHIHKQARALDDGGV